MVLTKITERRIRAGRETTPDGEAAVLPPIHIMAELFATTPPHIRDTNNTLAKGVHLETWSIHVLDYSFDIVRARNETNASLTHLHRLGTYSFSITPNATGASTTLAHATHRAMPLTGTAFPTISFVSSGVTALANTVLHAVSRTLSATSAPAISVTRLDAVPPGLHPTSTNPKNRCFPRCWPVGSRYGNSNVRPMMHAERGIKRNWHSTPTGMEDRREREDTMVVKSDRSRVMPVPNITLHSVI